MNRLSVISFVALLLGIACACTSPRKDNRRNDTFNTGEVAFACDESFGPIIEELCEVYESQHQQATLCPIVTNETECLNLLLQDSLWLVVTARNYKAEELQNLRERTFQPRSLKLAYDGLALIVNRQNNDTCISVQDVKRILTGEATKWSDLYPGSTRGNIEVVFDNPASSTVHFAEDSILGGKAITNPNVVAAEKSAEVISYVEKNAGAIGIIGSNWLNDKGDSTNLTFNKDIHVMSLSKVHPASPQNSFKPYQYYFYNGSYPFVRTIYALINDPYRGLPTGFAHFMADQNRGQLIFLRRGFLPAYGNLTLRNVRVNND